MANRRRLLKEDRDDGYRSTSAAAMAVNAMRTRHADFHQGPGRSPNSEAGYTQAMRRAQVVLFFSNLERCLIAC